MAPMFLVSNLSMIKEAINAEILGTFPTLNYRKVEDLNDILVELNKYLSGRKGLRGNYGVNLIVQKSNPWFEKHLAVCVENKVPVIITSLGNPEETIRKVHQYGGKVFCDVTNVEHADKCFKVGCDGFVRASAVEESPRSIVAAIKPWGQALAIRADHCGDWLV